MSRSIATTLLFVAVIGLGVTRLHAQQKPTLTNQLIAEGTASLAKAAREKGDAVRGAILFSQKKFACVSCHAQGASDLLGPDLTEPRKDLSDEYFVESILQPSKVIKKGFESTKILTNSGDVISGRTIKQDDGQIVLRQNDESKKLIRIASANIESMKPNEKSAMPDGLVDQLANRQQFLDLVKYTIDIAGSGGQPRVTKTTAVVDQRIHGLALLDQHACMNCHRSDSVSAAPTKTAPDLSAATARIQSGYLLKFMRDPHKVKPGTSMPNVMGSLSADEQNRAANSIAAYLNSLSDEKFQRQAIDKQSAAKGNGLFHSLGCVACHSPRDDAGRETLGEESVALGDVSQKYSVQSLSGFLKDPHAVRPSGRMPNMKLTHWESIDIANYLLSNTADTQTEPSVANGTASDGKRYFRELGCASCHQISGMEPATKYPSLEKLDPMQGCLSAKTGKWPMYDLADEDRAAMATAIKQLGKPMSDADHVNMTMLTFRCLNCHQRDGIGGITDQRDQYFQTLNPNLGPQGRIPPTLTGVGGKLKSKWLRQVLVSGRAIRPYIQTRMPQYGANNIQHLVPLLEQVDQEPEAAPEFNHGREELKELRKTATDLVGNQGLNCIACHTFQQKLSPTMPAVDLTEMAERLHKDWFFRYMRAPQAVSPGTVMPSFWPGGKAIREAVLDGNSDRQIDAIWQYLQDGRQARQPRGLNIEPIELLATSDKAVMLRRSYQGIGKRGIGVGYPGNVNLAFDAEQLRLAMLWHGKFADPGGVWRSQGHGTVRPLARNIIRFGKGPDLDDATAPWVPVDPKQVLEQGPVVSARFDRPPNHRFKGYFFDDAERPTFMYEYQGVTVNDYFLDQTTADSQQPSFQRQVTFQTTAPRPGLNFRVGSAAKITKLDDGTYRLGDSLRVKFADSVNAKITVGQTEQSLIVPLDLKSGQTKLVFQYIWERI